MVIHPVMAKAVGLRAPQARLQEAVGLTLALDLEVRDARVTPLRAAAPATLFGKGKVEELKAICIDEAIDIVVIDGGLTPVQQRNLERAWNAKVIDRTGLILEIFGRRARTREGKLQVELARLDYERSRLVRTWTHLERQRGGFGFLGGPGETQIEADRRLLLDRIVRLKRDLAEVRRTRTLQRSARKRVPYPTLALVGYTNAGKSTLFNRLTEAEVLVQDMLFATLDPTLRQIRMPGGRSGIISDTVGFISDLPHELVEAFRATLEEVAEADIILHVRDVASPDFEAQRQDVEKVLSTLGLSETEPKLIEIWNKVDQIEPDCKTDIEDYARGCKASLVSATTGEGVAALILRLGTLVDHAPEKVFDLAQDDGEALAWLYRNGRVTSRSAEGDFLRITARLDPQALGRFEQMRPAVADHAVAGKA